jgi:hypothetical protein
LQIEETILLREIEVRAVQFAAMRQTGSKVSLRYFCLPNFCLEFVKLDLVLIGISPFPFAR